MVLENMAVRRIFGPKKDEVTEEWGKLRNEELNDLFASLNLTRLLKSRMLWARHVARMWERRGPHMILVGKLEGKIPLGRPRHR